MALDHSVEILVAVEEELDADTKAVQWVIAGPEQSQPRNRTGNAAHVVVVLPGLAGDVVPEPLGLLVRVGVTPDVDEERGVVSARPLDLVQAQNVGNTQRDHTLAQHMLHRLPEAEVDAQ
ncbi:MAG TPA: hypothetical protein VGN28_05195 [Blastococcus sp.]|nr:hypothetical protein [Blastococcus sp.]